MFDWIKRWNFPLGVFKPICTNQLRSESPTSKVHAEAPSGSPMSKNGPHENSGPSTSQTRRVSCAWLPSEPNAARPRFNMAGCSSQ